MRYNKVKMSNACKQFKVGQILFADLTCPPVIILSLEKCNKDTSKMIPKIVLHGGKIKNWIDYLDYQIYFAAKPLLKKMQNIESTNIWEDKNIIMSPVYYVLHNWRKMWLQWDERSLKILLSSSRFRSGRIDKCKITFEDYQKSFSYLHLHISEGS